MSVPRGEALEALVRFPFARVEHVASAGSTNQDLLDSPFGDRAGAPQLLWADVQTAGRGRRGRTWNSREGTSLTFSVAIEFDWQPALPGHGQLAAFSLAAGVALAESLEATGMASLPLRLKWPNDLVHAGGKVAGILIETRQHGDLLRMVVGCGINLRAPDLPGPHRTAGAPAMPAAGLVAGDRPLPALAAREQIVAEAARALVQAHRLYLREGLSAFRARWLARDWLGGRQVVLIENDALVASGRAAGIADSGALLIDGGAGARAFAVGDVSVRPAAGTPACCVAGPVGDGAAHG